MKDKNFNIKKGQLWNDLDCPFDEEGNKIDVYTSVYWSADTEEEYNTKERFIEDFYYEDDLIKAISFCDISGFDYWVKTMEEENYVSINVYLKKEVDQYTQQEAQQIADLISKWDEMFLENLT